jgi:hypothetical protein
MAYYRKRFSLNVFHTQGSGHRMLLTLGSESDQVLNREEPCLRCPEARPDDSPDCKPNACRRTELNRTELSSVQFVDML